MAQVNAQLDGSVGKVRYDTWHTVRLDYRRIHGDQTAVGIVDQVDAPL